MSLVTIELDHDMEGIRDSSLDSELRSSESPGSSTLAGFDIEAYECPDSTHQKGERGSRFWRLENPPFGRSWKGWRQLQNEIRSSCWRSEGFGARLEASAETLSPADGFLVDACRSTRLDILGFAGSSSAVKLVQVCLAGA
jgi:hypothetical protein